MDEQIEAKKKAVKQLTRTNKLAKGKQPIKTRDPMLDIQDVEAAKTRAMQRNSPHEVDAAKWAT